MVRFLIPSLLLIALQSACVSSGSINERGYTHKEMGYSIEFQNAADRLLIGKKWKIELNQSGQLKQEFTKSYSVESISIDGNKESMLVQGHDLIFKHLETNGVISVQSFPLQEEDANKKLAIIAKDFTERVAGNYMIALGSNPPVSGVSKNLVTNIVESRASTLGSAETYEAVIEVANAEQLRLNPQHRLMKYKLVLIRPQSVKGWHTTVSNRGKTSRKLVDSEEIFPAMIVLLYAMDYSYYNDYVAEFDGLFSRLKLRD